MSDDREPGYYRDPSNGDLWHLSETGWSWVNGNRWTHLPEGLVRVADPNPFRASMHEGTDDA